MPQATKDLSVLGSSIEIEISGDKEFSRAGFHHMTGSATIVLEGTFQVGSDRTWVTVIGDDGSTIGDISTNGLTSFPIIGYAAIRARCKTASANTMCALGFN